MNKYSKLREIHQKKIGVLLLNARTSTHKSTEECAKILHIPLSEYLNIEQGQKSISLPQLETLAFYLNIPTKQFLTNSLIEDRSMAMDEEYHKLTSIRNKTIATILRQKREARGLTAKNIADELEIPVDTVQTYESGNIEIPLAVLEQMAFFLDFSLKELFAQKGSIGRWNRGLDSQKALDNLSDEIQSFISNPSNEPYLRLAMHLSEMSAEKLRTIAEGLLEITY